MEPWKARCGWPGDSAGDRLQWGHGDGAVEEQESATDTHANFDRLQWGHGDGAVEEPATVDPTSPHCHRFNGATAMEPWKSTQRADRASRRWPASMGPRRWSRGRASAPRGIASRLDRLQWGHGDGAVEEARRPHPPHRDRTLQWGHGDGAVEEHAALRDMSSAYACFNGATAMEPWKSRRVGPACESRRSALQWGHGDGAVEERERAPEASLAGIVLQWGHGDGAVEERWRHAWQSSRMIDASMGPRR